MPLDGGMFFCEISRRAHGTGDNVSASASPPVERLPCAHCPACARHLRPCHHPPSPLRRAYLEGVLRTAGDMALRLGNSGLHNAARMLEGCSCLLEQKLADSGNEDGRIGVNNVTAPETACNSSPDHGTAGSGGLCLSTSPPSLSADCMGERAGAPESDPEQPFGVSVAWAIAIIVASWISAMYQILWLRVSE